MSSGPYTRGAWTHVSSRRFYTRDHRRNAAAKRRPKAIAGIGRLADTLEDRSVIIPMRRKRVEDRTAPLREDRLDLLDIRRQCHRWANDHLDALRIADPQALTPTFETVTANWT